MALCVGEYGTGERVSEFTLVEADLAFHAEITVFDPVEHGQRRLDPADFAERKLRPVVLLQI